MGIILCYGAAGMAAGAVTGILGSGGGLVMVPLLSILCKEKEERVFSSSLAIMLPICACSFLVQNGVASTPFAQALPYLAGGAVGGSLASIFSKRIPIYWLHRVFGCLLLWSGVRCLFF